MTRADTTTVGPKATALLTLLCLSIAGTVSTGTKPTESSLKNKSDEELLAWVMGPKQPSEEPAEVCAEDRVKPSPLDRLWEMPTRDAALELVKQYGTAAFNIENVNAKPPASGEIGLRWTSGNAYATPEQGVTILKYDGYQSALLMSQVQIIGRATKEEIERAVMKTDIHPLPRRVAQQAYEIIWWLQHVRISKNPSAPSWGPGWSTADDYGSFWIKPDGPKIDEVFFGEPCGQCIDLDSKEWYPSFAYRLISRVVQRSGIKSRYPIPIIGAQIDPDEDAKFLHTPPPDREDAKGLKQWLGRLTEILHNPERQYLHDQIMEVLVPISDPLRYDDKRINNALLDVLHRGLDAQAKLKRFGKATQGDEIVLDPSIDPDKAAKAAHAEEERQEQRRAEERKLRDIHFDGLQAAEKLGVHDAVRAFPELFSLAKQETEQPELDRSLIGAASIAARHPECRAQLADYLKKRLSYYAEQISRGSLVLEAVWRADLRVLTPQLEQIAALPTPPPDSNDVRPSAVQKASVILMAWRETDALTKTKLDALLTGYIGGASYVPEVLRKEFAAMSPQDQLKFRQFITWMRTVDVGWSRYYLENAFTPHTPRPNIQFER